MNLFVAATRCTRLTAEDMRVLKLHKRESIVLHHKLTRAHPLEPLFKLAA